MNLLIIDDEIETINGIMTGVDWEKLPFHNVYKATCVDEAKNMFETHRIDAALCDIEMPDGSGLDLLEWVNHNYTSVLSLVLTCHAEFSYAKRAVSLACRDYLLKPVDYGELTEKLREICTQLDEKWQNDKYQKYGKDWIQTLSSSDNAMTYTTKKEMIDQVKVYIRTHLQDELKLDTLAGLVSITQDYLSRLFKKEEGISINEYIVEERMLLAQELLKSPALSISRVAYECGYDNYSYFTKVFKKKFGETPREYRSRYEKL